jgi:hypothetical protein
MRTPICWAARVRRAAAAVVAAGAFAVTAPVAAQPAPPPIPADPSAPLPSPSLEQAPVPVPPESLPPPPAPLPPPPPLPPLAPVPAPELPAATVAVSPVRTADAQQSDHESVVARWGFEGRRLGSFERTPGQERGCEQACPVLLNAVGLRRWTSSGLAWNAGVAFSVGGGSGEQAGQTRTWDTHLGLGPTIGVSFLLAQSRHLAISAGPQADLVFFMPSENGSKSLLAHLRGIVEAEVRQRQRRTAGQLLESKPGRPRRLRRGRHQIQVGRGSRRASGALGSADRGAAPLLLLTKNRSLKEACRPPSPRPPRLQGEGPDPPLLRSRSGSSRPSTGSV